MATEAAMGPTGTVIVGNPALGSSKGMPEPGEQFGHYHLIRVLGKGGMGVVYEAEDIGSSRRVALKVLRQALDSPDARKRFLREGQLAAAINHPHSVYVFGTEEVAGTPVISMEFVSGGNLQDKVKSSGPMPVGEAVDSILQIIDGLEAAQQAGILHRDVKPSNCFIDASGAVKVGDFGLSVSTNQRVDPSLTGAGIVMGTPAFSSPEQLRGEELTVRSDIYSVGVTLYFLLTGRTPFQGDKIVHVLAAVLGNQVESPVKWRREIPGDLASVILRCLHKVPSERYANYAEFREALLPYVSTAPVPAPIVMRFFAGFADVCLVEVVAQSLESGIPLGWSPTYPLLLLYFAITDRLGGSSLGKLIFRLRVVSVRPRAAGLGRAFLRAMVVLLPFFLLDGATFFLVSPGLGRIATSGCILLALSVALGILYSTARRRNGLAALHDLASATRVVMRTRHAVRPVASREQLETAPTDSRLGPYHVLETVGKRDDAEVLLGFDGQLLRKVWLRKLPVSAPVLLPELRHLARPGRLRWLGGRRSDAEAWDAYEAASGRALLDLRNRETDRACIRFWLLDLAKELAVANALEKPVLRLDRVWITDENRAKLLDFTVPTHCGNSILQPENQTVVPPTPQEFLFQVASVALTGRPAAPGEAESLEFGAKLPLHAREILQSLLRNAPLPDVVLQLEQSLSRLTIISPARRVALFLSALWVPLFLTLIVILVESAPRIQESQELDALEICLNHHRELSAKGTGGKERADLETYIAGRFTPTITGAWSMASTLAAETDRNRALAGEILARRGQPSPEEFAQVKAVVEGLLPGVESDRSPEWHSSDWRERWTWAVQLASVYGLCVVIIPGWFAALFFRGGVLLRAFGIAVITKKGAPASRGRVLWRSFLASAPFVLIAVVSSIASEEKNVFLAFIPAVLVIALAVASMLIRGPTFHDRIAGTDLVPR